MRSPIAAIAATALLIANAGPVLAGCAGSPTVQIGAASGDPEKDTLGLACSTAMIEQTGSVTGSPRGTAVPVGASTGEPEKDTLGYMQTVSSN